MAINKDFLKEMFIEWKNILLKPKKTLSKFPDHKLSISTLYILIAGFITSLVFTIIAIIMGQSIVGAIFFTPIFVVISVYFTGLFVWIIGKLFGTEINLVRWLSMFLAAWAPIGALSGIQFIGFFAYIYGFYILYLSTKNFMKLSTIKSISVLLIYIVILVILPALLLTNYVV